MVGDRDGGQRVEKIMGADEARPETRKPGCPLQHVERGPRGIDRDRPQAPVRTFAPSVAPDRQRRTRDHLGNVGVLVRRRPQAIRRQPVHQAPEGALHVREVPVDVGVVELDAREHRGSRPVVEELRALVEEGGVVLVALDDDPTAVSQPVVALEVLQRDPADHEGGVAPGGVQESGEEGSVVVLPWVPGPSGSAGRPPQSG